MSVKILLLDESKVVDCYNLTERYFIIIAVLYNIEDQDKVIRSIF
jgi:hypothetical protein